MKGRTVAMILLHSWNSLQTTFPTRAMEWFLGLAMMLLGLVFFYNAGLFAAYPGPLAGLARIADQPTWAGVCFALGFMRIGALLINGLWWRSPLVRCIMAFLSAFVWYWLSFGLVGNVGISAAFLPLCFVFDVWNAIRCGRKVGVSEFNHRLELRAEARYGHSGQSADA